MIALVTGAEQGLGATLAQHLAAEGYEVRTIPGDVMRMASKHQIENALHAALPTREDLDALAVVVNNYGINHLSWIGETSYHDEDILRVNVMGPYWVVNFLVHHLKSLGLMNRELRVVNVASQTYRVPQRTTSLYCASKAALVQMTRVMARELAPYGWLINAVAPGKMTDTEMARLTDAQVRALRGWDDESADRYAQGLIPLDRYTTTDEVSTAILGLLRMPPYVTGTVLDITGGV